MTERDYLISGYPSIVRDASVKNYAPATAEVAQTLIGRVRWLYEMATGGPAVAGESIAVPMNPQGLYGVDHSGPPYGQALRHSWAGMGTSGDTSAAWTTRPASIWSAESNRIEIDATLWVKPFPRYPGSPMSRGYISALVENDSAECDATLRFRKNNSAYSETETVAATSWSVIQFTDIWLDLIPGRNRIVFSLEADGAAASHVWFAPIITNIVKDTHD